MVEVKRTKRLPRKLLRPRNRCLSKLLKIKYAQNFCIVSTDPVVKPPKASKKEKGVKKEASAPVVPAKPAPSEQPSTVSSATSERDMNMAAVLTRLATRASKADAIVANLKTQLSAVRKTSGLTQP